MSTRNLIEKIEALRPEQQARVEHFVDEISHDARAEVQPGTFPLELLHQINAERDVLYRQEGLIDTQAILRDLRERGGR